MYFSDRFSLGMIGVTRAVGAKVDEVTADALFKLRFLYCAGRAVLFGLRFPGERFGSYTDRAHAHRHAPASSRNR